MHVPKTTTALLMYTACAVVAFAIAAPCAICQPPTEPAEPPPAPQVAPTVPQLGLEVAEFLFATGYDRENRVVIGAANEFAADVQQVVCFTRITGAQEPTVVTHAWYYRGLTEAKVQLAVGSASWRTYSTKKILPAWTGPWEVKVLDENGAVLATAEFTIQ